MIPPVLQTIHHVNKIKVIFSMVPESLIKWFWRGQRKPSLPNLDSFDQRCPKWVYRIQMPAVNKQSLIQPKTLHFKSFSDIDKAGFNKIRSGIFFKKSSSNSIKAKMRIAGLNHRFSLDKADTNRTVDYNFFGKAYAFLLPFDVEPEPGSNDNYYRTVRRGRIPARPLYRGVRLLESFSYPCRISSAVQNSVYFYLVILDTIIDGERKPLGKKTLVPPEMHAMNSRK
jgi:hypothetical protein